MERAAFRVYRRLWGLLDWVYPPTCAGCSQSGFSWCPACDADIDRISPPLCEICGKQIAGADTRCTNCQTNRPDFSQLRSYAYFQGPVRHAIHRFKYQRDIGMGTIFATFLQELYTKQAWAVDLILPVPLSKARIKQRGYNQAAVIAYPLSLALGRPYCGKALFRIRETRSQVGLSLQERFLNVENAFAANKSIVSGKSILLIDDVTTTGSTLSACASALFTQKAASIQCLTVARARDPMGDRPKSDEIVYRE